jgi:hypothetical protein
MLNDNEEEIVEAEEVEETEAEAEESETEAETNERVTESKRQTESLEDRKARLERQLNQTNKKLGIDVSKPEYKSSKSDDFDYAEKAYLKVNGIDASEFDFVRQEMKNAGKKDIDAILSNPYFKSELESRRELNRTAQSTIKGKRSNGVATDSVEYWMGKPIEDVPADMRIKVVNAKLQKENSKGVFYNS